jgi:hypothetical protein
VALGVLAVLASVVAGTAVLRAADGPADRRASSPASSSQAPTPLPVSSTRRPLPTDPSVLRRGGPTLDGFGTGALFLRSIDTVYRLGLTTGQITATSAAVGVSATVGFLAGPDGVILRPLDYLPGLFVPDDRPARELTGRLRGGSQVLRGPGDQVWVSDSFDGRSSSLTLVDFAGRPAGPTVRENGYFLPDGSGGLLLIDTAGVWESRAGSWRRITTGSLLATGPHHYLLGDCGDGTRLCRTFRYDRRTRQQTELPADRVELFGGGGVLSADGRYVAVMVSNPAGVGLTEVVELSTGRMVTQLAQPSGTTDVSTVALWSSRGHRLAALSGGRLVVLDPAPGGATVEPDLGLNRLVALTLRP